MLKITFIILIFIPAYFEQFMPDGSRVVMSVCSPMWAVSFIYLRDFWVAEISNKSTPFYTKFYAQLSSDISESVFGLLPVLLLIIFASNYYGPTSIDIAALAFPFLYKSFRQIFKCRNLQIADQKMPARLMWALLLTIVSAYVMFFFQMKEIFENKFSFLESSLIQITILATSLYAYFGANLIRFILEEKRMEIPLTILDLLTHKRVQNFRNMLIEAVFMFNLHIVSHQAQVGLEKIEKQNLNK